MDKDVCGNSLYEDELTDYSDLLEATSSAFGKQIKCIISKLSLKNGMSILDVGAGIGHDMIALAEAVAPEGRVDGLEIARPHFERAARNAASSQYNENINIYPCDLFCFDSPDQSYDMIWCKYTLACFLDPLKALLKMKILLKEGGRIVVINDLCPMHWLPGTLLGEDRARESRLCTAIFEYINRHRKKQREEFGVGGASNTSCAGLMRQAGYREIEAYTVVAEEIGRLSQPLRKTLQLFLQRSFPHRAEKYLSPEDRKFVKKIRDPDSPSYLLNRSDLHIIKPITALIGSR
jgi:ubiquinone/menaquinone biosynthesis C-methylase UbiE